MCAEKQEQKREETRKIQILELRFVLLAPLKSLFWGAKSGGNKYPGCREGRLKPRAWLGGHPSNAAPALPPAQGRKEATEPQAEHAAWCSQTFLRVADQPCELLWRDGWKLLGNSKSKKKMGMRKGMGKAPCKQQDRGMLRE